MPIELLTIPCLKDNYAFLLHDTDRCEAICIDVPEAGPIMAVLSAREWPLTHILLTHHHDDHIAGVAKLQAYSGAKVVGAAADAARLPPLDLQVADGDTFEAIGTSIRVLEVPGHTVGHIAFHMPETGHAFTGDSLMAGGCGRLFEGTPEQMWHSLNRLSALPAETLICSGHEYTQSNLRFAHALEPENAALISRIDAVDEARADGKPSVPSVLADELATNPFLRAHLPALKAAIGMPQASDAEAFAEIRSRKDNF
ncbi:hydroxyacylglutathione hydrolase [Falsirhodobacter deserti]|uniref:hydroxyacylglutathione hydrolase n=1 Tax=Falsirhodobacter deserti TaxID=1365611 RepID=UPI000FE3E9BB|nr:hydroxyacylglutathione hydrolase [Falsirhodobacter deserti]